MRIATFNLENLDDEADQEPPLAARVAILRPQTGARGHRRAAPAGGPQPTRPQGRTLAALDTLLAGTSMKRVGRRCAGLPGLLATLDHTEIHNEYLPDESGAFRTDAKFPESDHAPVVAHFSLLDK